MMQVDIPATLRRILDESSLPDDEKNRVLSRIKNSLGLPKTLDDVLEDILAAARMDSAFSADTAREMLEPVLPVKTVCLPPVYPQLVPGPTQPVPWVNPCPEHPRYRLDETPRVPFVGNATHRVNPRRAPF